MEITSLTKFKAVTSQLGKMNAEQAAIAEAALSFLSQREKKLKEKYAAELSEIEKERAGIVNLSSLFGGPGKATNLTNIDVASAGVFRCTYNRAKPSRTTLTMLIVFCIVKGEEAPDLIKSPTFVEAMKEYRKSGTYYSRLFYAGLFSQIADELGYTWKCDQGSKVPSFSGALYSLCKKGFLRKHSHGWYEYTGKDYPRKG